MNTTELDLFKLGQRYFDAFIQEFAAYGIRGDPEMELRRGTGMLCYYDLKDGHIYLSLPDLQAPESKLHLLFLRSLISCQNNEEVLELLQLLLPHVIAHELAHHFRHRYGMFSDNLWHEEQTANQLAIAVTKHRLSPAERGRATFLLKRAMEGLADKLGLQDVAAASPEAIRQGDYQLVVGEVHLFNTLARSLWVTQHPAPEELFQARQRDIPEPCVFPVPSKEWNVPRLAISLVTAGDIWFVYEAAPSGCPRQQTVTIGELVVEQDDNGLQVRTRDGRLGFDMIEFFGYTLSNQCMSLPSIPPPAGHIQRITVDDVVIVRQSWQFPPAELSFARLEGRAEQFLGARRWTREQGLPRFLFVHAPTELKPYYIDLESPIYVEILAKLIRQSQDSPAPDAPLRLTEMLPRFDQLWLTDATGARYTSELRFVVLDPKGFGNP